MIPALPGTYVLVLRCTTSRAVQIGRIGVLHLAPGWYLYVGSAFGPGGLRGRINHHVRRNGRPHWLIDYVRRNAHLESVWYYPGVRCEHEWAPGWEQRQERLLSYEASGVGIAIAPLICSDSGPVPLPLRRR